MGKSSGKVGLWLVGAGGRVGSAVALGIAALGRRHADRSGLVTALPAFDRVGLVDPGRLVVGGHEVRRGTLLEAVREAHSCAGLFDANLIRACAPKLAGFQRNIRKGTLCGAGPTVRELAADGHAASDRSAGEAIERLSADIADFRRTKRLDHVVVVNVASAELRFRRVGAHARYAKLASALTRRGAELLPPSALYALAAIEAGCPFVNFTPSPGLNIPAIRERADALGVPYMGNDGKTGETLVKSALAPMFATRNLEVLSWVGQNLLGNRDGAVLRDPATRRAKVKSKDKILSALLGGPVDSHVGIEFVASLDDWKVAWDFIHFRGFLGTKMKMQFTWEGCDSILAAPLVIDLARLAAGELRRGASGPMRHLAFFFKDPIDVDEHNLVTQWNRLVEHVTGAANAPM